MGSQRSIIWLVRVFLCNSRCGRLKSGNRFWWQPRGTTGFEIDILIVPSSPTAGPGCKPAPLFLERKTLRYESPQSPKSPAHSCVVLICDHAVRNFFVRP